MTLWAQRMGVDPATAMMAFTASLSFDRVLGPDDVRASIAHVRGLGRSGIISEEDVSGLIAALTQVDEELSTGTFAFAEADEDIHSAIERRVTELCAAGARLHTGRSRNDQVATAFRLHLRRRVVDVANAVLDLAEVLVARARDAGTLYLPGYTHLQRAQPVPLAHQLLAHGWSLQRDFDRLVDAHRRLNVSPLGAGALGGSSLPLDPAAVALELGFHRAFENSLDAVSDRDFAAEVLFDVTLLGVHLSRLGEEIVIYSSEEFGYYLLDDAWSTGSSMLPQKKNPDIAELVRAKSGRLIGQLSGLLATLKGLPLAYDRDLQEDKEPLFDALQQTELGLRALAGLVSTLGFDGERMANAADSPTMFAVDLAEWLVARGTPFRDAHGLIGSLVRRSLTEGVPLAVLVEAEPRLGAEAAGLLAAGSSVQRRVTAGGGGSSTVPTQLEAFVRQLAEDRGRLAELVR